jgi:hypothetical protein
MEAQEGPLWGSGDFTMRVKITGQAHVVPRPKLYDALDRAVGGPVTVVAAPAARQFGAGRAGAHGRGTGSASRAARSQSPSSAAAS